MQQGQFQSTIPDMAWVKITVQTIIAISLLILLSACLSARDDKQAKPQITVPMQFIIVTDMAMTKRGVDMQSWVTRADIEDTVLPEVNRIWAPAGISFVATNIIERDARSPPDKADLLDYIVNARRDAYGRGDPKRIRAMNQLIDWSTHDDEVINIYLVPYLGETSQGNARRRAKRVFVAQFTDKPSRAQNPPARFQLTEPRPFEIGSLSRTLAHEIGHILSLKHPDRQTQTVFGQLMGGRRAGYLLTPEQIEMARERAQAFELTQ